jgi:hypothetical protein
MSADPAWPTAKPLVATIVRRRPTMSENQIAGNLVT